MPHGFVRRSLSIRLHRHAVLALRGAQVRASDPLVGIRSPLNLCRKAALLLGVTHDAGGAAAAAAHAHEPEQGRGKGEGGSQPCDLHPFRANLGVDAKLVKSLVEGAVNAVGEECGAGGAGEEETKGNLEA